MVDRDTTNGADETIIGASDKTAAIPRTPDGRRRGGSGLTGAVLLITVGVLFLLSNLGTLEVDWLSLFRFWPVLLILVGLDIVLGRRGALGSALMAVIALLVVGGVVYLATTGPGFVRGQAVSGDFAQPLGDVDRLEVKLDLGASDTELDALSGGSNAVEGAYTSPENLKVVVDYHTRGGTGVLEIYQEETHGMPAMMVPGFVGELDLGLTTAVPVDLVVDAGVGDLTLDLTGMDIRSLVIDGGVGSLNVILPAEGRCDVDVGVGVGSITIEVPPGMEAQISYDGGLSHLDVAGRFEKIDGLWQTGGYSRNAKNSARIDVDAGVGSVTIR
jgi:hypothetical protein